jgi:hypothetical protein
MTVSISKESKSNVSITTESKPTGPAWDDVSLTWDNTPDTWDGLSSIITRESKNSVSIDTEDKI